MHYRIYDTHGKLTDEGEGSASYASAILTITPRQAVPILVKSEMISKITEPFPYWIGVELIDNSKIELSELGQMRTQLLRELDEVGHKHLKDSLLLVGIGKPNRFTGFANGVKSDIHLYDDAMVAFLDQGEILQIPYSFITALQNQENSYELQLILKTGDVVILNRFANQTSQLLKLLSQKISNAKIRTSAFLSALLPGLSPIALRSLAAILADGVAGSRSELAQVDDGIFPTLINVTTIPELKNTVDISTTTCSPWIGFKQKRSVERGARGGDKWHDPTHAKLDDHGGTRPAPGGFGGFVMAEVLSSSGAANYGFGAGFGEHGSDLAYDMLGMSMFSGRYRSGEAGRFLPGTNQAHHEVAERSAPKNTPLRAAHTDYTALKATGKHPVILSFMICACKDRLSIVLSTIEVIPP